jgi:hypothetical protein
MVPVHPHIKRVVQEEICQDGTDDTLNAKDNLRALPVIGPVWRPHLRFRAVQFCPMNARDRAKRVLAGVEVA